MLLGNYQLIHKPLKHLKMNNLCIVSAQSPKLTPIRFVSNLDLVSSDVEKLRADGYSMIVVEPIAFGLPTED